MSGQSHQCEGVTITMTEVGSGSPPQPHPKEQESAGRHLGREGHGSARDYAQEEKVHLPSSCFSPRLKGGGRDCPNTTGKTFSSPCRTHASSSLNLEVGQEPAARLPGAPPVRGMRTSQE